MNEPRALINAILNKNMPPGGAELERETERGEEKTTCPFYIRLCGCQLHKENGDAVDGGGRQGGTVGLRR